MKLATTTGDFSDYNLTNEEAIRLLHKVGFRHIDLSFYRDNTPDSPFMQDDWVEYTNSLKLLAESLDMDFVQAHSPSVNPLDFGEAWEQAVQYTIRSIEACGILGIPNTVVHSGWASGLNKEEYFKENLKFFSRLFPYMEKHNVNVCIENSTKANMGDKYYFFTGEDMNEFIEYANHPMLKACWDTGHANIEGHQYEDILALGDNLTCIHFNDNRGQRDEHIIPFAGSLSMDEVMHALIDIDYKGVFTFEADSLFTFCGDWICARKPYKDETRLLNPPIFLKEQLEKMMYDLGVYILKAYDCFEE